MAKPRTDPPRGLLNLDRATDRVRLGRYLPSDGVGFFVEHYWVVQWDLRGLGPFTSESLPYPSVHLVHERGTWHVTGVTTGRFSRTLHDAGNVFGVKFRPGGFRPFIRAPVASLTDVTVAAIDVLDFADELTHEVDTTTADAQTVEQMETVLLAHLPERDERISMVAHLVEMVASDRSIVSVGQLEAEAEFGKRALQRLFREYVGVSPKWVIQRYRLFEAAERLTAGADGARIAHELGYFDQAHFIRDFKAMVGQSPGAFAGAAGRRARRPATGH